ncbi:MAG: response regulator transcription factor [Acidobacteria bacterium]|nr:response regulator transcription factor [Acidobacteriota bacterium]
MEDKRTKSWVLIIEDDPAIVSALRVGFEHEDFRVIVAADGVAGLKLADETNPSIIILDLMLPKINGIEVCRQLRAAGNLVPIIMLTARRQEVDKIVGLKMGADDYVTKPFSFMELMARVEAVLRRVNKPRPSEIEQYKFGDVFVNFKRLESSKNGKPLNLTPREFDILEFFIQNAGKIVTREQLLDKVWGYEDYPFSRTVDMHIAKLRQKIEDEPTNPKYLITVHRVGYKFLE